jgi:predicted NAD/FAD-binding protein
MPGGTGTGTVAVVGAGIAGLTAAYLLQRAWPVTLYEAAQRLGGHAHTHRVACGGREVALDTAFLVYNESAYPNLARLFRELAVVTEPSDMSLSVQCGGCGLEYSSGSGLRALPRQLQQASQAGQAGQARGGDLAAELTAFNLQARRLLGGGADPDLTLGGMLAEGGYSASFISHVVLPLVSIIWSCDLATAGEYPAGALLAFMENHGLLTAGEATRWRTVSGGSASYVERVAARLSEVCRQTPVRTVHRMSDGVEIRDVAGHSRRFDRVVIAVHPSDALGMLADPTAAEKAVLSALPYTPASAVLHTDASLLPRQRVHRSSWNHRQPQCRPGADPARAEVTYDLNRLQNIAAPPPYLVTLGDSGRVNPERVLARMEYEHPVYTVRAAAARARLPELATPVTAYAGAYHGWGFHEDGCRSGVTAAGTFGATW